MTQPITTRDLFNEVISQTTEFGVERQFFNLADISGPAIPGWIKGETLYELYIRSFTPQGTLQAAADALPRLKEVGINTIWLMPVSPIGREGRKGSRGSPYAIKHNFEINPEYGNRSDFRRFVDTAHQLGQRVILDLVANHVSRDYDFLKEYPELIKRNKKGQPFRKIADWSDVADLDYSQSTTREHVTQYLTYWLEEFNIDGYRCDVAGLVPADFWQEVIPRLKTIHPELYMLAEWESPYLHTAGFHSCYDWSLYRQMIRVQQGRQGPQRLLDWILFKRDHYPQNAYPLRFLENHDQPRARELFRGAAIYPFLTLLFSVDGLPLLYNGQETGTDVKLPLFDKRPIDWNDVDEHFSRSVRKLVHLRKQERALHSSIYRRHNGKASGDVLVFAKGREEKCIVVLNFSNEVSENVFNNDVDFREEDILFNSHEKFQAGKLAPYQSIIARIA